LPLLCTAETSSADGGCTEAAATAHLDSAQAEIGKRAWAEAVGHLLGYFAITGNALAVSDLLTVAVENAYAGPLGRLVAAAVACHTMEQSPFDDPAFATDFAEFRDEYEARRQQCEGYRRDTGLLQLRWRLAAPATCPTPAGWSIALRDDGAAIVRPDAVESGSYKGRSIDVVLWPEGTAIPSALAESPRAEPLSPSVSTLSPGVAAPAPTPEAEPIPALPPLSAITSAEASAVAGGREAAAPAPSTWGRVLPWIVAGGSLLAASGATYAGLTSLDDARDVKKACPNLPICNANPAAKRAFERSQRHELASNVLWAGAAVGAVGAVILWLREEANAASAVAMTAPPVDGGCFDDYCGLSLLGRF
jgi:hypothetical protein